MWHDVEQNTDEWFVLRADIPTSSNLNKIMANYGKCFGEPAKKYAVDIALAQIKGFSHSSSYKNEHMERGNAEEPLARMAYEAEYFCEVTNGGIYIENGFGGSPDGLVGNEGLIEIKSAIPSVHFSRIKSQSFDTAYKWQLIGNLYLSGREWIDFISYCSDFPIDKQLYVYRAYYEQFTDEYEMIKQRLIAFNELVETSKNIILQSNYSILT